MNIRIGYMPGLFPEWDQGRRFFRHLVEIGDQCGYDSIWFSDRVVSHQLAIEPIVAMALVAALSEKMKFGTAVTQLPLRNPVVLAKEMASLDYLSGGRFLPAFGLGGDDPREYQACGVKKVTRARRTDEAITVMRRLWTEESVTHEGEFFTLDNVAVTPKPVQKPCMPMWIGGRSMAAANRAGRLGDGWLVSSATPTEIRVGATHLFATASEHGRNVDADHIGAIIGFYIAASLEKAVANAQSSLTRHRPDVHFTEYTALGTPHQVADTLDSYSQAGISKFVIRPQCHPEEAIQQLVLFSQEVLPRFHKRP
jgi:probable F420-dependent oxidoreductase